MRYSTHHVTPDDEQAVLDALRSEWLTRGPRVEQFEESLAEYVGARYAVALSSGTMALELAWQAALPDAGGLLVEVSPLSFVASANAIERAGHQALFRDVDPATGCADVRWLDSDACVVHFAGRAAPVPAGRRVIIEDACHALGATGVDGYPVGSCHHSLAAVFSFHPVKPITTGEGGMLATNDEGYADEVRMLANAGRDSSGHMIRLGTNGRMSDIQAALGLSQLKRCDAGRNRRRELALRYRAALSPISLETTPDDPGQAWHLFPVLLPAHKRDAVKEHLHAEGIGAQVHYSPIIPLHPWYRRRYGYTPGEFPHAEMWAAKELSLPLHAGLTDADVDTVVRYLVEALDGNV